MRPRSLGRGSHGCPGDIVGVNRWESPGNCERWRSPVALVVRFNEKGYVVVELEGIAGAKFLGAEKTPIARAEDCVRQNLPGKTDARSEVIFVGLYQAARCPVLSRENQLPGGEIQVGYLVVGVVEG